MSEFNGQSTAAEVIAGIDLSGKVAVVTGASAGLGIETSRVLAGAGARVVMVGRDPQRVNAALQGIHEELSAAQLESCIMDLASLASVRQAAAELLQRFPRIDLLINNAGVMACPLARTADGFELQFGTNHLGHFLFTGLLVPALLAAAPARVITLSSNAHRRGGVNFDDPNFNSTDYDKWVAYGASKTANALFALALDRRLASRGVRSFAVHPGAIGTELGRHLTEQDFVELGQQLEERGIRFKTVPQGAATSVWAATAAELASQGGLYLEDCQIARPAQPDNPASGVESWATDTAAAEQLWSLSEQLVGQVFGFDV
jgi:NAD(P)-dependent dehydrogenase (short-subunit alcohol dehydrogenase family)